MKLLQYKEKFVATLSTYISLFSVCQAKLKRNWEEEKNFTKSKGCVAKMEKEKKTEIILLRK